jgi:hypothetical protein
MDMTERDLADRHSHTVSRIAHGSVDDQYKEIYIDIEVAKKVVGQATNG